MSIFFFHIHYGELQTDVTGTHFESLAEARVNAVQLVGELLKDQGDKFWATPDLSVCVTDDKDLTLWTLAVTGYESAASSRPQRMT